MLKLPVRPRQIDWNKPLLVLVEDKDLPFNENDFMSLPKNFAGSATGMEKEEESELHIQQLLLTPLPHIESSMSIPVPELMDRSEEYNFIYRDCLTGFRVPDQLIQAQTSQINNFSLDNQLNNGSVDYDLDSEDELFLGPFDANSKSGISCDDFEALMDCFEKGCGKKLPLLNEAMALARKFTSVDQQHIIVAVYDYWLEKRLHHPHGFLHSIKQEHQQESNGLDPYVAFRRRSEKMQTRRHRKTDETSYEKMFRFHHSLLHLKQIMFDIYRREIANRSLAENKIKLDEFIFSNISHNSKMLSSLKNEVAQLPVDTKSYLRYLKSKTQNEQDYKQVTQDSNESFKDSSPTAFQFIRNEGTKYCRIRAEFLAQNSIENSSNFTLNFPRVTSVHDLYTSCPVRNIVTAHGELAPIRTEMIRRRTGRLSRQIIDRIQIQNHENDISTRNNFFTKPAKVTNSESVVCLPCKIRRLDFCDETFPLLEEETFKNREFESNLSKDERHLKNLLSSISLFNFNNVICNSEETLSSDSLKITEIAKLTESEEKPSIKKPLKSDSNQLNAIDNSNNHVSLISNSLPLLNHNCQKQIQSQSKITPLSEKCTDRQQFYLISSDSGVGSAPSTPPLPGQQPKMSWPMAGNKFSNLDWSLSTTSTLTSALLTTTFTPSVHKSHHTNFYAFSQPLATSQTINGVRIGSVASNNSTSSSTNSSLTGNVAPTQPILWLT